MGIVTEKLYHRYEYLAAKYAKRIFAYEELSYEYEDLLQEFRLKIYTSIRAYGRRWGNYRRGSAPRPVPLRYYLEAACGNKTRDFMKYISREGYKVHIDAMEEYDYGTSSEGTEIVPDESKFVINGVDLLEGLKGTERTIFILFLKGYTKRFFAKVSYPNSKEELINRQRQYLITRYGEVLRRQPSVYWVYSLSED